MNKQQVNREKDYYLAIISVSSGMSIRKAAEIYELKTTTLFDRLNGACSLKGKKPTLSRTTERILLSGIYKLAERGFGLTKSGILQVVYSYLKESNQESIFKSGKPADKWYYSFLNRHPDLRVR